MRPLCWMKMVSHVRLPCTMGGEHECRKLNMFANKIKTYNDNVYVAVVERFDSIHHRRKDIFGNR